MLGGTIQWCSCFGVTQTLAINPLPIGVCVSGDNSRDLSLTTLYLSFEMRFSLLGLGLLCVGCLLWESIPPLPPQY